jgi:hypothetical protein
MPDLSPVKVFGCMAYVRLQKVDQALTKLGPRNVTDFFMRLEPSTKAYRVLIGNDIRVSRDVSFSEKKLKSTGTVDDLMPEEHEDMVMTQMSVKKTMMLLWRSMKTHSYPLKTKA